MTWCDKLASTPSVGFQLDSHFAPAEAIMHSVTTLTDGWHTESSDGNAERPEFQVTTLEPFKVELQHNDGFNYIADFNRASVAFQHKMKYRHVSAGLPVAELTSSSRSFSDLLEEASDRLIEFTTLLPKSRSRGVKRAGVVSVTVVSIDDVPPGIRKFIDYMGRPWKDAVQSFNFQIIAKTASTDAYWDRCIHTIARSEDEERLLTLSFDYQRYYHKKVQLEKNTLQRALGHCRISALDHFEELAVGNSFDELPF